MRLYTSIVLIGCGGLGCTLLYFRLRYLSMEKARLRAERELERIKHDNIRMRHLYMKIALYGGSAIGVVYVLSYLKNILFSSSYLTDVNSILPNKPS